MKTLLYLLVIGLFLTAGTAFAQQGDQTEIPDSTGLPGDHFSLEGALEMFKTSDSPEQFEEFLNKEDNYVNNLDLDGDGETDYICVADRTEGSNHCIVLYINVSESETQDVAVIEIEKTGNEEAMLQILGDSELYGDSAIVEPVEIADGDTKDGGPCMRVKNARVVVVNVFFWPCVKFIYKPAYVVYTSPYRYRHYPNWWKPWRPYNYTVFYRHHKPYHAYYRPIFVHRVVHAHNVYIPHRRTSVIVVNRYKPAHNHYREHHNRPYYQQKPPAKNPGPHNNKHNNKKVTPKPKPHGHGNPVPR